MTTVSDNFNRADTSTITGATELSGDWAIVSNKVQCNDDLGGLGYYLRYDTSVGSDDMYAQVVTTSTQANGLSNAGVLCRGQTGATNTSYQFVTNIPGDGWAFWRIVAGTETQIVVGGATIVSGDTVRLEVIGSLLRGRINGTLVALAKDTNIASGSRGGCQGWNGTASDVVELDNFEAGAITDSPLTGPFIAGWSDQITGTGTTLTPTIPSNVTAGDCVCVMLTSRDAAQTMASPGSEGWATIQSPSQTGLEDLIVAKIWGLGGQTDDTTPTFTIGSGTAGWGATAFIIRNPSHGTSPWTSTSAAIVGSGSQSNSAAANATAPSVSHSGSHRTVVRLFSSADDNALKTPSEGALAFGDAAFDSTTGNDFSQAATVFEDRTVTTSTGTATVAESVNGNDVSNGVTLIFAIPTATTVNATLSAPLGGSGLATATPTVLASIALPLGGTATATAVPTVRATLVATLGGTASATATRQTFPTAAGALGGAATATATRQTSAAVTAALGGSSSATATVTRTATAVGSLGGSSSATAGVSHTATAAANLGFNADGFATGGNVIHATAAALLGGTLAASATVAHLAQAVAALGGSSSAAAIPQHAAVLAAVLGGTTTAAGVVQRNATALAALGFTAAGVVVQDDPNPVHAAFGDSGGFAITEAVGVRFEEAAAA